ncbi:hypothetical protein [Verrucomicrobium sp. BvORR106]|uniref:hypothetical protein n=1 Tax=Verrucomicrobium sp. BvORR106 TaxID=1403819 RepID=UPI0005703B2A|nr:hypothetical protein [Verrucomicrobium sp. BvORR106]
MPSVHDNYLYGYEFDARTSTLVLRTCYPHNTPAEFTDVWFYDVWTHHVESVLGHDIIFDIEDSGIDQEVNSFGDLFKRLKEYGWPRTEGAEDSLPDLVQRHGLKVWHIASSYGVAGFVVARSMVLASDREHSRLEPPSQP